MQPSTQNGPKTSTVSAPANWTSKKTVSPASPKKEPKIESRMSATSSFESEVPQKNTEADKSDKSSKRRSIKGVVDRSKSLFSSLRKKKSRTVVCIDSDVQILEQLTKILEELHYFAMCFTDSVEGKEFIMEQLHTGSLALVISSMMMPGISGMQLMQEIRALKDEVGGEVKFLLMSSFSKGNAKVQEFQIKTNDGSTVDIILKPLVSGVVVRKVRELTEKEFGDDKDKRSPAKKDEGRSSSSGGDLTGSQDRGGGGGLDRSQGSSGGLDRSSSSVGSNVKESGNLSRGSSTGSVGGGSNNNVLGSSSGAVKTGAKALSPGAERKPAGTASPLLSSSGGGDRVTSGFNSGGSGGMRSPPVDRALESSTGSLTSSGSGQFQEANESKPSRGANRSTPSGLPNSSSSGGGGDSSSSGSGLSEIPGAMKPSPSHRRKGSDPGAVEGHLPRSTSMEGAFLDTLFSTGPGSQGGSTGGISRGPDWDELNMDDNQPLPKMGRRKTIHGLSSLGLKKK